MQGEIEMNRKNVGTRLAVAALAVVCVAAWSMMPTVTIAQDHKVGSQKTAGHMDHPKMSGPFDGKHFAGQCGVAGKTDGSKEVVTFQNGMFTSSYCLSQGFKPAPYTRETKEGVASFKSEQTDPKMGTLVWEGTITGDTLTASGTLTSAGKEPSKFWIKATSKAAQHATHEISGKK
jgi:hypothetical protein